MSAHQTKSSIKTDSHLQNTDTFSSRHVHFIVSTHNAPGLGYTDNPATNTLQDPNQVATEGMKKNKRDRID